MIINGKTYTPRHPPQAEIDALVNDAIKELIDQMLYTPEFVQRIATMVYGEPITVTKDNRDEIWLDATPWLKRPPATVTRFVGTPAEQAAQLEAMLDAKRSA